jgi:hypothetical protein
VARPWKDPFDAQHAWLEGVGETKFRQYSRVVEKLIKRFMDHAVPENLENPG